jgi:aspartate aminotransferase/aminotransferase
MPLSGWPGGRYDDDDDDDGSWLTKATGKVGTGVDERWIARRMGRVEASGIRKAFELAKTLKDPVNLSIGLPDFDVPGPIQDAAVEAIRSGANQYTLTMGLPELRSRLQAGVDAAYGHADRQVIVTSGASGGLSLAISAVVDPGDEAIVIDPYFVMYNNLIAAADGVAVLVDSYPDFGLPIGRIAEAISPRTKCVIVNSPGNPTGAVASAEAMRALAALCRERNVLLISDEVYGSFVYDGAFASPAQWNEDVLVVDGFSKSLGMTGWRLGFAHGPSRLVQEMAKLQQFSYVCAPSPLQAGVAVGLSGFDFGPILNDYRRKRDRVAEGLGGVYEMGPLGGAFYAFVKVPEAYGSGTAFAAEAVKRNLVVIPGNVFSRRDSHFRVSYAVSDAALERGIAILREMAGGSS